ncbi:alpha/beta fold hydrolase [Hamadaea tsunoensis]|uniref:alpha/beta fold hydrolase n=1 Tax=Hamadaea tsunoensis TaxID=53368 RepID=UPI00041399CC|nr:alpha/beta hydrolase [Hamadaea tsunoensis]
MSAHRRRLPRRQRLTLTAIAGVTALALTFAGMSSAFGAYSKPSKIKPTVVLVHGAFADASGWNAEIGTLRRLGYPVVAAANPLRGLTSDADYVRALLQSISGPIVLVGHSYGGAVITNAARGVPNVRALVYIGAFLPDQGESIATTPDPATYPSLLGPGTTQVRPVPNAAAVGGTDLDLTIKPEDFRSVFAGDVPAPTAELMAIEQRPLALTAYTETSGAPSWRALPTWDLITLDDQAINPAGQRFMAERAHARVQTVHSSHAVMVSHPDAVTRIVLAAIAGTD